jgi:hypothetical protein
MPAAHNLIESGNLVQHFREHPPEGFVPVALDGDVPAFSAKFDLLTTLEPAMLRRLERLPLARVWRRWLRPMTCFIGTTVTEYGVLPADREPEPLVGDLLSQLGRYPFLIIKDLPTEGTLVGDEALDYSRRLGEACRGAGFVLLEGQALAYVPIDFVSTEEYLSRLSHARRKNVRRKLRSRGSLEVETIATGDPRFENEAFLAEIYALYGNVYAQSELHFDRLTLPFFRAVLEDADVHGIVFLYRAGGLLIGFNLCLCENGMLIDKYVGLAYPEARDHDLYTVSWFHNLEYALARGCRTYIAGWTDPEIKRQLGARFTFTTHAVFVRNPILRALLRPLRKLFESDRAWESAHARNADS